MATTQASVLAEGFDKIPREYAKEFIAWLKKNKFFRKFFTTPAAYGTADARERDLLRSWKRTRANEFLAERKLDVFNKRVKAEGLLSIDDLAKKVGTERANIAALLAESGAKGDRPSRIARKKILDSILSNKRIPDAEIPMGGKTAHFKPINATETIQLKRIFQQGGTKGITLDVITRIDTLLNDPKIASTLKKGNLPTLEALSKAVPGITNAQATLAVSHIGSILQGKHEGIFPEIKLNKEAGKKIANAISKAKFGDPYYGAGYKAILDAVDSELGRKIGTFEDFKNQLTAKAKKMGIPLYNRATGTGFSVNELASVRGGFKRGFAPYSQWVDLSAGVLNEGDLGRMQSKLSTKLEQLQKAVSEGRLKNEPNPFKLPGGQTNWRPKKGVDNLIQEYNVMRDKFIKQYPKANVPEIFTSLKGSEFQKKLTDVYSKADLATWKDKYGLDLAKNLKERKIGLKMPGRPIAQILDDPNLSKTLTNIKESIKGLSKKEQIKFCSLLSRGGLPGNCAAAIDANPVKTAEVFAGSEATTGAMAKVKNASTKFLSLLGRGGVKAAPYAAIAAVGAAAEPLVKQFRNDDPTTYMTDENQQKGVLLSLLESETPKVDEEILNWQYPGIVGGAAAAIPGSSAMMKARKAKGFGLPRQALGPVGKVLAGSFSPLGVAASLPIGIAAQVKGGAELEDIATDPFNWMGPAFASTGARMATRGMAPTGILSKALRLGMKPSTLRMISSRFGLPGLALSAGLKGYDIWQDSKYK